MLGILDRQRQWSGSAVRDEGERMTDGAGNDKADGGSRSPAQSAVEEKRHSVPGQDHDQKAWDELGVWRKRRGIAGDVTPRPRWKLAVVGGIGVAGVIALAVVLILGESG